MLSRSNLLRERKPHEHARVGFVELFYDLVFVFAITQLSHSLLEHYSLRGAIETLILFMAVWWTWIDTAWVTNWLDPAKRPVRLMLLAMMLAGLVLSTSIPEAFGERGIYFALAYAFMQVGRSLFTVRSLKDHNPANYRNFQRITAWCVLFSCFWIAGAFAEGDLRLGLWALAVLIETSAPGLGFFVPGMGRATTAEWDVEGGHLAERCGLFVIIALGESILVTGATFGGLEWGWDTKAAFFAAFAGSVALWWIYFDIGHELGSERIVHSADPGRLARLSYTYLHMPIIAGIIVAAVGDEFSLVHPLDHPHRGTALALLGGPALFLAGTALFKRSIVGQWPISHIAGVLLLLLLIPISQVMPLIVIAALQVVVLILVAAVENADFQRKGPARHP
jgi:low temperature requirement protein LtrA